MTGDMGITYENLVAAPESLQTLRWGLCVLQSALQLHHMTPSTFSCFHCTEAPLL